MREYLSTGSSRKKPKFKEKLKERLTQMFGSLRPCCECRKEKQKEKLLKNLLLWERILKRKGYGAEVLYSCTHTYTQTKGKGVCAGMIAPCMHRCTNTHVLMCIHATIPHMHLKKCRDAHNEYAITNVS